MVKKRSGLASLHAKDTSKYVAPRYSRPCCSSGLSSFAHIIGVAVTKSRRDQIATDRVTANSRKRMPTMRPSANRDKQRRPAIRDREDSEDDPLAPRKAAYRGSVLFE